MALLSAAASAAMIISPVAFHRALFRQGRKPELVRFAHRMATGGLGFMLIAMVSAVLLVTDFVLDRPIAFVLSARAPGSGSSPSGWSCRSPGATGATTTSTTTMTTRRCSPNATGPLPTAWEQSGVTWR